MSSVKVLGTQKVSENGYNNSRTNKSSGSNIRLN